MGAEANERLHVEPEEAGTRLDAWLSARLGISRARARRLVAQGAVQVDGRIAAPGAKGAPVPAGATVEISAPAAAADERPAASPETPLRVCAEGPGWVAVEKPAAVPVHPLVTGETGTLLSAVVARHPEIVGVGEGGLRSGVVHRLDVDTSGVLLFATTQPVWERLRDAFASHRVDKRYRALVRGALAGEVTEEVGLVVARHRPARVRVLDPRTDARARGARLARLHWRALESLADATLLEIRLETGHLHQIRATFAARGHPVLGDRVYGETTDAEGTVAPRQMLHAARVAFEEIEAECADPEDFAGVLERLRTGG